MADRTATEAAPLAAMSTTEIMVSRHQGRLQNRAPRSREGAHGRYSVRLSMCNAGKHTKSAFRSGNMILCDCPVPIHPRNTLMPNQVRSWHFLDGATPDRCPRYTGIEIPVFLTFRENSKGSTFTIFAIRKFPRGHAPCPTSTTRLCRTLY